jgi:predicted Zn-dependent protease
MAARTLIPLLFAGAALGQWSDKERALGRQAGAELEKQYRRLDMQQVTDYFRVMAGRLSPFSVDIVVLDTDEKVRASLPGGRVYLSTGFILAQRDEPSLAIEVAHQIVHLSSRHGMRTIERSPDTTPVSMVVSTICTRPGGAWSVPLAMRDAAKRDEAEANATALRYVTDAGYRTGASQTQFDAMRQLLRGPRPKRPPTLKRAEER